MKNYVIQPDGAMLAKEPENGHDYQLKELNDIVGGHIEIVTLRDGRMLVCNENGISLGLRVNPKASEIYWANGGIPGAPCVGNILICQPGTIL